MTMPIYIFSFSGHRILSKSHMWFSKWYITLNKIAIIKRAQERYMLIFHIN